MGSVLTLIPFQSEESREILHFHYTKWPDFGVPSNPEVFLEFLYAVRRSKVLDRDKGPAVVHCSAGIGRSGTFCIVDTLLTKVRFVDFCLVMDLMPSSINHTSSPPSTTFSPHYYVLHPFFHIYKPYLITNPAPSIHPSLTNHTLLPTNHTLSPPPAPPTPPH